jgi:hypothetical protein
MLAPNDLASSDEELTQFEGWWHQGSLLLLCNVSVEVQSQERQPYAAWPEAEVYCRSLGHPARIVIVTEAGKRLGLMGLAVSRPNLATSACWRAESQH